MKLSAGNLKDILWDTLQKIRDGKIPLDQANAIAHQARAIARVVRTEIVLVQAMGEKPTKDIFPS